MVKTRTLFPRPTWPWSDLDTRIAEVAGWAQAGADLHRPLRLLTLPLVRRTNAGFIPALVKQGVAVPQDIVLKTRNVLNGLVDSDTTTPAWQRYARWLVELDRGFAVDVLRDLALTRKPDPERYQAWLLLHEISPGDSVHVGGTLIADPSVTRETRFRVGDLLAEFDLDAALDAFSRVSHGAIRNQAAQFIARYNPERAVDFSATAAADPSVDDVHRLEASRHVLAHQRDRGLDLHFALLTTTKNSAVRTGLMDDLRREVPEHLTTRLNDLYRTGLPAARPDFARYLVQHLGGGPEVTLTLANDQSQTPETQFRALKFDPRPATPELVTNIIKRFPKHNQVKVEAIALLAKLSPDAAFDLLRDVVAAKDLAFRARMDAIPPSRHLGSQRLIDLYRILAVEPGIPRAQRDTAATAAMRLDAVRGKKLYEELARNPDLSVDDRLHFIRKTGRSLDLFREFARESGAIRIRAAQEAASQGTKADKTYLRQLAVSPSLSYTSRKPIIDKLPREERIAVLTKIIGNSLEDDSARLTAGKDLGRLDREKAAKELAELADDPTLPRAIKNQARNAARAFR